MGEQLSPNLRLLRTSWLNARQLIGGGLPATLQLLIVPTAHAHKIASSSLLLVGLRGLTALRTVMRMEGVKCR
jgi:hypothetical protein